MTRAQRAVLVAALLSSLCALAWVPYVATYKWSETRWTKVSAGYSWLLVEPPVTTCKNAIEEFLKDTFPNVDGPFDPTHCSVSLDAPRIIIANAAIVLLAASLLLTLGAHTRGPRKVGGPSNGTHAMNAEKTVELSEVARELLSIEPHLPIGPGDMSEHFPLVITSINEDYVSVEYSIVSILNRKLNDFESEFDAQGLIDRDGRMIDALTFKYRKPGSSTWTQRKTYYFDVTAGFMESSRRRSRPIWKFWK